MNYQNFTGDELIDLLFTEEDRLPRSTVDEFVLRGKPMIKPLSDIVSGQDNWTSQLPRWWAVVHACFILGAIGGAEVIPAISKAIRFSSAYDCDWVTEHLPSIFGRIGTEAAGILESIVLDVTSDWYPRTIAMEALAAVTIVHPEVEENIFVRIGSIFNDNNEDWDVRQSAGNILIDFLRDEYKDELLSFGREEQKGLDGEFFYGAAFTDSDVSRGFLESKKNLWSYTRDWLLFYDENEIRKRQQRWQEEKKEEEEAEKQGADFKMFREDAIDITGTTVARQTPKIGRNEPCPCGSGKKYKKCCLL